MKIIIRNYTKPKGDIQIFVLKIDINRYKKTFRCGEGFFVKNNNKF